MVFHSYIFLVAFLPMAYACFLLAHRVGGWPAALHVLAAISLAFYAQWSWQLLAILMTSVAFNYAAGASIMRLASNRRLATAILFVALAANIGALGYFKYTNFLIDIANQISGRGFAHISLILPIGVSFYTFVQIGYLIEAYNGQVEAPGFGRYVLFATFFPCVTAGPLVMQREMFEQMRGRTDAAFDPQRLSSGMTIFVIGLFKKVVLADSVAPFANTVFDGVVAGGAVEPFTAWVGAICYALQLYFDFSGYSDMAVGLGCMFGLKLPLNFDSPFKATNISDFWRRWHMTMTRFFTSFIFTPMAMRGMRKVIADRLGEKRAFVATAALPAIVTFLVAGVWHGAGWSFVVYGLIHGIAIATYLAWDRFRMPDLPPAISWLLTMYVVVSGLVVFRAPDLASAGALLAKMWLGNIAAGSSTASAVTLDLRTAVSYIAVLGAIVLLMPNSQQILHRFWVSSDAKPADIERLAGLVTWRPTVGRSLAIGTLSLVAVASIGATSTFLYYQF